MGLRQKLAEDREARWAAEARAERANSPVGRAEAAHRRGDIFFQIEIDVTGGGEALALRAGQLARTSDVLGAIEATGWTLEHAGYVAADGGVRGVYLFRDASSARIGAHHL